MFVKLTKDDLKGKFPNAYEAAKAAQDGNSEAWMILWTHYRYYNHERIVVDSLQDNDTGRAKAFYVRLSDFERGILECRREGLTLAKIADKFKCHVTTVKLHLKKAKEIASMEFQVAYA